MSGREALSEPRVIAYVASWSVPAVIDTDKITHINFAFASIDASGKVSLTPQARASLQPLLALRQKNARLKVLVSVGGWAAEGFSDAASTDESRRTFARSAVELLREQSLDGIDLDWEYPGQGVAGIKFRPADKQNFTSLLQTLREALNAQSKARTTADKPSVPYLLTIASADREYFDHTEMQKLHVYLDWINVMTYDFFNSLTSTTGHHAGLYASPYAKPNDRNADASVKQHLGAGIPPEKIVLGVPFYGRGFNGVRAARNGLNQTYEHYDTDYSYNELVEKLIDKQGFVRYWDERARAPYLWNSTSKAFISYEDSHSLEAKTRYIKANGLGGIMLWELSQDRNGELLTVIDRGLR